MFAHTNQINFNDYLKNKKGIEILKNIKSKNTTNRQLSHFFSYDLFITLTKTYFKFYNKKKCPNISIPTNIYNSNTSFIFYKNTLIHLRNCDHCNYCTDITQLYECNELRNILYPYGNYIETNMNNENIYLHSRFNLDKWCKEAAPNCNKDIDYLLGRNKFKDSTEKHPKCKSCSHILSSSIHKGDCSSCYIKYDPSKEILETENFHMFPSQNRFILQSFKEEDNYEQSFCTNAYAMYPNIRAEKLTKPTSDNPSSLCKKTSPLFI